MYRKFVFGLMMLVTSCSLIGLLVVSINTEANAHSAEQNDYESLIDFETIPGDLPVSDLAICNQFRDTVGVIFRLEEGGCPVLADVGGEATAFLGPPDHTSPDTPAEGQNVGAFFLTDDGIFTDTMAATLIVEYITPTAEVSGVILDLDLTEAFTIEARGTDGSVIGTVVLHSGDPQTGDGIATPWHFQHDTNDIFSLRFQGTRSRSGGFGLAFDNYYARSLPPMHNQYLPIIQKYSNSLATH